MKSKVFLVFLGIVLIGVAAFFTPGNEEKNEKEVIEKFFQLIKSKNISEAVLMINPMILSDESVKQSWGVNLNAFEEVELKSVEASNKNDWTKSVHRYKVEVEATMKKDNTEMIIPNYGWVSGVNIKWIEIEKNGEDWYLNGIASGP